MGFKPLKKIFVKKTKSGYRRDNSIFTELVVCCIAMFLVVLLCGVLLIRCLILGI